jgi:hypothetical protein
MLSGSIISHKKIAARATISAVQDQLIGKGLSKSSQRPIFGVMIEDFKLDLQASREDLFDGIRIAENNVATVRLTRLRLGKKSPRDEEWVDVTSEAIAIQNDFIMRMKRALEAVNLAIAKSGS